jgi:hypothetical protein
MDIVNSSRVAIFYYFICEYKFLTVPEAPYLVQSKMCTPNLYQNCTKIFQTFFKSKNKVFGQVQIPEKNFFWIFFHRFLGVFVPVPNAKKWYFLDKVPVLKVN